MNDNDYQSGAEVSKDNRGWFPTKKDVVNYIRDLTNRKSSGKLDQLYLSNLVHELSSAGHLISFKAYQDKTEQV